MPRLGLLDKQLLHDVWPENANAIELATVRDHRREPREIVRRRKQSGIARGNAELLAIGSDGLPRYGSPDFSVIVGAQLVHASPGQNAVERMPSGPQHTALKQIRQRLTGDPLRRRVQHDEADIGVLDAGARRLVEIRRDDVAQPIARFAAAQLCGGREAGAYG